MDTLSFLRLILPEDAVYYEVLFPVEGNRGTKYHNPFTSLEDLAASLIEKDSNSKYTAVYHACAGYRSSYVEGELKGKTIRRYRVEENWLSARSFWVDLDCGEEKAAKGQGYPTKRDAAKAIFAFCDTIGWPRPMLVDSGHGLHAYWPLTKDLPHEKWRVIARGFKATLAALGVLADPTRTADFASILRTPGTHNRKREPREVKVLCEGTPTGAGMLWKALKEFMDSNEIVPPKVYAPVHENLNDDLTVHRLEYDQSPVYGQEIAKHCAQMREFRDTQDGGSYELWRHLIGVLTHCEDGAELAEAWSARRLENHDNDDWQTRFETWNAGPTRCDTFAQINPEGCEGCPHKGKVATPKLLGKVVPEPQAVVMQIEADEAGVTEVEVPAMPRGFAWIGGSMVRYMPAKDGGTDAFPFSHSLFYPISRIRTDDGSSRFGIRVHTKDNRIRDFDIGWENIAAPTDMLRHLGRYGQIMASNHKDSVLHMTAYLKDSLERLKAEADEVGTMTSFGWKDDYSSFLIGDRLYMADGNVRKVLLGGYASNKAAPFSRVSGTLDGYATGLDFIYGRVGMEPLQYALCSGWGSLLTPFGDDLYRGLVLSLYSGQSGTGKSTVAYNSMYAFGDATAMSLKSDRGFTDLALWAHIGAHNNLPMLIDEVTGVSPEALSRMVYQISLGEERARLKNTPGGTRFADCARWATSPFMTANVDLMSLLAGNTANAEAEGVRVVQIHMDAYNLPVYKDEELQAFQSACAQVRDNMGSAGHAIISYCVKNASDIRARVRTRMLQIAKHLPETKFRFYRSHAACTLVMAEITRDLKIHDFDVDTLEKFSISLMKGLRANIASTNTVTAEDAFARMVIELTQRIILTYEYRDSRAEQGPENPQRQINGMPAGRYVVGNRFEKDYAGRLFLVHREVRDWCMKNRVDLPVLLRYLTDKGALLAERDKSNIARGTVMPAMMSECLEIDTTKLEHAVVAAESLAGSGRPRSATA